MSQLEDNSSVQTAKSLDDSKVLADEIKSSSQADSQELSSSEGDNSVETEKTPKNTAERGKNEHEVYKEVLEKLKLDNPYTSNQERSMQSDLQKEAHPEIIKKEKSLGQIKMEKIVAEDFSKIDNFLQLGLINSLQGQNLKKLVVKKAFDKALQNEKVEQNSSPALSRTNKNELFTDFNKNNPDFFSAEGRKEVLDYLKSDEVIIGKDDLNKISTMVKSIEKSAIDRYLKKEAYEKNLKESNDAAKQKLTANAQNSTFRDKNLSRTFTREQIGKMSSTEFTKYESLIMEQLKKGLIR